MLKFPMGWAKSGIADASNAQASIHAGNCLVGDIGASNDVGLCTLRKPLTSLGGIKNVEFRIDSDCFARVFPGTLRVSYSVFHRSCVKKEQWIASTKR
jgi:hypothetical protein